MKSSSSVVCSRLLLAAAALLLVGVVFGGRHLVQATHVTAVTMAVDTDTAGNTYTANPSAPADTNNQDNSLVSGTVEGCSTLALPALGATANRNIDILLKDATDVIATDVRLTLRDSGGAVINPDFAEIVSFNARPFSDATQDTDQDGDPPPASGGTGTDPAQPVGFLNLPVDPVTVGTLAPGSAGGLHRDVSAFTNPATPIPAGTVEAFASATYNAGRDFHISPDHPHNGTEVENGATAPYVSNSANGVTIFRVTIRVKNLATGANDTPFLVLIDLNASTQPGPAVLVGRDLTADGDIIDAGEEDNNPIAEGNLADGGLQVGGTAPVPCPPAQAFTATPTMTGTPTPSPTDTPAVPTPTPTPTPTAGAGATATPTSTPGASRSPTASPRALPPSGDPTAPSTPTAVGLIIAAAAIAITAGGLTFAYRRRRASG